MVSFDFESKNFIVYQHREHSEKCFDSDKFELEIKNDVKFYYEQGIKKNSILVDILEKKYGNGKYDFDKIIYNFKRKVRRQNLKIIATNSQFKMFFGSRNKQKPTFYKL
jgi:hypothetical protein